MAAGADAFVAAAHGSAASPMAAGGDPGALEADTGQRLLNLVPLPTLDCSSQGRKGRWEAAYALSPATANWARQVREAHTGRPALVVGFVGATSAGKSWLVSKMQGAGGGPQPDQMEQHVDGLLLQSVTSDINLYVDPVDQIYHIDFEGTYGTQPLQLQAADICRVVQKCADSRAWEDRRRRQLKEAFQPTIAYLMCDVVVFLTREKLVCRRALEECEQFAVAANRRVTSALPPALVIVQNCCRPSEGFFDTEQCTQAFRRAHLSGGNSDETSQWTQYFRSIDCFCIPDEFTFCKRSGFDGEEVCMQVLASLRQTLRRRLAEQVALRPEHGIDLSQVQWFSVLSTLCSIVNNQESVVMSAIYVQANATNQKYFSEVKSILFELMHPSVDTDGRISLPIFSGRLEAAIGIVARFVVLRDLDGNQIKEVITYLLSLFPCGASAPADVERFDGRRCPVVCGQCNLMHKGLHRSSHLVRTVSASWLQGLSEWIQGGVTHAWAGTFACHPDVQHLYDATKLEEMLSKQVEEYRVEKCLEGVTNTVCAPWVLKAHCNLRASKLRVKRDSSRMCVICTAKASDLGALGWLWWAQVRSSLPVCDHCYGILEQHGLCSKGAVVGAAEASAFLQGLTCTACEGTGPPDFSGAPGPFADHRVHPCRCAVCRQCAEQSAERGTCPLCDARVRWIADERALLETGWRTARSFAAEKSDTCGVCVGRRAG